MFFYLIDYLLQMISHFVAWVIRTYETMPDFRLSDYMPQFLRPFSRWVGSWLPDALFLFGSTFFMAGLIMYLFDF